MGSIKFPSEYFTKPTQENIDQGLEICSTSKILFCGIARNVEKTLQRNIDRIHHTAEKFKEYKIFIYENDSTDNTKDILKQNKIEYIAENNVKNHDYIIDIQEGRDNNFFKRCKFLAKCRNKYLDFAREKCSEYDYICIIDLDIHGWSYEGFYDSIFRLSSKEIASVSAYGVLSNFDNSLDIEYSSNLLMYDSFAFRPVNFKGPWTEGLQARCNYLQINTPSLVRSNFGGMAIYKMNLISQFNYDINIINGYVDSEHIYINDCMSKLGYKHLINPFLITSYSKHRFCYV
jgi:hypothetical protein